MIKFQLKNIKMKLNVFLFLTLTIIGISFGVINAQALNEDPVKFVPQVTIPGSSFVASTTIYLEPSTAPIAKYISAIYNYGVGIVGIMAAVMLMLGGIIWLTSAGSSTKVEQAKSIIGTSLIGMVLVLTAVILLRTINPELTSFKSIAVESIKEREIPLIVEACNWKISSTYTINAGQGGSMQITDIGCVDKESPTAASYCSKITPPTPSQLADDPASDGKKDKKAVCCCVKSAYGLAATETGKSVIDVDNSGIFHCCTILGELIDGPNNRSGFATIQSKDKMKATEKCLEYKTTATKTEGGKVYHWDPNETNSSIADGKCSTTFDDNDPLKDQCKGKDSYSPCKYDGKSALGSGYCVGNICKKCLPAGGICYSDDKNLDCAGSDGLCGGEGTGSDCNTFTDPDPNLQMCWGKPATVGNKLNVGEECTANNQCIAGLCCLKEESTFWGHKGGWCWPNDQRSPERYDLHCIQNQTN
ncbi:MAG: hypothetical protein WCJ57_01985 [Candidatus Falkowbacteria bacterium]